MKVKIRRGRLRSEESAKEKERAERLEQTGTDLAVPPVRMGLEELYSSIRQDFGEMLRLNIYLGEDISQIRQRERLRRELRKCGTGDWQAKAYVIGHIKELLLRKYHMTEEWIEQLYPLDNGRNCFAAMLFRCRKKYGEKALEELFPLLGLVDRERIDETQILSVYRYGWRRIQGSELGFPERLELLAQRIYEDYKGNSVADELMELELDGISGGVSGGTPCVWMMFQGRTIQLAFLPFPQEKELERVCRNICRSNHMGQLSERKGYLVTELPDGSRVSVARPPFCEGWVFFIRKFRYDRLRKLEELITGAGSEQVIRLLRWLVRGERILAITGEQGAGKTTLLAALVGEIPERYNLRVQELAFELQLRKRYPGRNVVSFRETGEIDGQEGLDFAKKTDGSVTILGEVACADVVRYLVQLSQNASAFTMFTHHAGTTEHLIYYLRNALLQEGGFRNEEIALEQAASAVQYDVHLAVGQGGERYLERVTEIMQEKGGFTCRELVKRTRTGYQMTEELSIERKKHIRERLTLEEQLLFDSDMENWRNKSEPECCILSSGWQTACLG
ncbi:MAG: Flp pilus assembly complex ATPase component TadA [Lachnospiraceae bacterium]|jgi:pilus assembly protein CpaF|nr:Flp pilus assembly complex ATPase component TadA [Lachnospiraceae bacterium]